jgi:hypothetical protein
MQGYREWRLWGSHLPTATVIYLLPRYVEWTGKNLNGPRAERLVRRPRT